MSKYQTTYNVHNSSHRYSEVSPYFFTTTSSELEINLSHLR